MASQSAKAVRLQNPGEERSKRWERAQRILDAASDLIQRWGYKKTTIDDIARMAGVAKGTIYLHWKTREDLFMALLLRESIEASLDVLERINNDPEGMFLSNLMKHGMYVIMTRPLAKALLIQDTEMLGKLVRSGQEDIGLISQQKMIAGKGMVELLRSKGMLRNNHSITTQMKMYNAIFMGFMMGNQYLPDELQLSPEESAEAMAETIRLTLEPDEPVAPQVLQEVKASWDQIVQQMNKLLNERLQKELDV